MRPVKWVPVNRDLGPEDIGKKVKRGDGTEGTILRFYAPDDSFKDPTFSTRENTSSRRVVNDRYGKRYMAEPHGLKRLSAIQESILNNSTGATLRALGERTGA